MRYDGQTLRISPDQTLLMGFITMSRRIRCGEVVACLLSELESRMGGSLLEFGIPVSHVEIERTLWRLVNCRLTFPDVGFDGSILAYADARHAPDLGRPFKGDRGSAKPRALWPSAKLRRLPRS